VEANRTSSAIPWHRAGDSLAFGRMIAAVVGLQVVVGSALWLAERSAQPSIAGPPSESVFDAAVTSRFHQYYRALHPPFLAAELELAVAADGSVQAYRLAQSSGDPLDDRAILAAASRVQTEGLGTAPPDGEPRIVTLRPVSDAP
jgi:hypothetical protein